MLHHEDAGRVSNIEEGTISEDTWQRWQAAYAVKRKETFLGILEARGKHLATLFMENITVISNARDCFVELVHRESDPATWIVRRWTKFMWFNKQVSSDWFNDERQARAFAEELKQKHEGK